MGNNFGPVQSGLSFTDALRRQRDLQIVRAGQAQGGRQVDGVVFLDRKGDFEEIGDARLPDCTADFRLRRLVFNKILPSLAMYRLLRH